MAFVLPAAVYYITVAAVSATGVAITYWLWPKNKNKEFEDMIKNNAFQIDKGEYDRLTNYNYNGMCAPQAQRPSLKRQFVEGLFKFGEKAGEKGLDALGNWINNQNNAQKQKT